MAGRLNDVLAGRVPRVHVVSNAVNRLVVEAPTDPTLATRLAALRERCDLLLAYPTRPYPHKNLAFLRPVADELSKQGTSARFAVTLRSDEMASLPDDVAAVCANFGELKVGQIATLMRGVDGVFFPSLLEAYSATPLEALALGVPLYASDRDFVRSVCGKAAVYFDPVDAKSTARTLLRAIQDPAGQQCRRDLGQEIAATAPDARKRAESFLSLLYGQSRPVREAGLKS